MPKQLVISIDRAAELLNCKAQGLRDAIDKNSCDFGKVWITGKGTKVYKVSVNKMADFLGITPDEVIGNEVIV